MLKARNGLTLASLLLTILSQWLWLHGILGGDPGLWVSNYTGIKDEETRHVGIVWLLA